MMICEEYLDAYIREHMVDWGDTYNNDYETAVALWMTAYQLTPKDLR